MTISVLCADVRRRALRRLRASSTSASTHSAATLTEPTMSSTAIVVSMPYLAPRASATRAAA
eukprot:2714285-Prymnesium_polylepis.1